MCVRLSSRRWRNETCFNRVGKGDVEKACERVVFGVLEGLAVRSSVIKASASPSQICNQVFMN